MPTKKLNDKAKTIIELCSEARDKYTPEIDGTTYCNLAVRFVARGYAEYTGFGKMLANQMHLHMAKDADWVLVDAATAKKIADDGKLVVASRRNDPHGHVAIVMPGRDMITSGKWGGEWPVVSNVGSRNWICGVNYAFAKRPEFFVFIDV